MRRLALALAVVAGLTARVASATAYIVPDLRYVQATVVQPWIFAPSSGVPVTITGVGGSDSLDINGTAPAAALAGAGTAAGVEISVLGATGGATSDLAGATAGRGANITLTTGTGGAATGGTGAQVSGAGGTLALTSGGGGLTTSATGTGGAGGPINITAGNGTAGGVQTGGAGGTIQIFAGAGANGTTTGGNGGNVILRGAAAGTGGSPTNGIVIARAPAASYGTTFAVQTNLGASNFTVTDTGAFTASAASTITAGYAAASWPLLISGTGGSSAAMDNPASGAAAMRLSSTNGAAVVGSEISGNYRAFIDLGTNASGTNTRAAMWWDAGVNALTMASGAAANGLTLYLGDPNASHAGSASITSTTASGANTGFTLSLANSPITFLNGNASQYVLSGAAPASVAGNGTAAINGVLTGATGGASSGTTGQTGGTGSSWTVTGGTGGAVAGASGIGGAGGATNLTAGNGGNGAATGGAGGGITLTAGNAGTGGNAAGGIVTLVSGTPTGSGTNGSVALKSGTNGTAVITFQQSDGTVYATADSTNKRWRIGDATAPTATLDVAGTFTVAGASGDITKYNNETAAGQGVAFLRGVTSQKLESGADTNVLTVTPASATGTYRISISMAVSAQNTATLGWTATWTDTNGSAQAPTNMALQQTGVAAPALTFTAATNGNYYATALVDVNNAGTNIVVKTTFSGTSITYRVSASVERVQ